MYAHRMIVSEKSNFAKLNNLPKQLHGLPLEIIILPMIDNETLNGHDIQEIIALVAYNDKQSMSISSEVDICSIADDVNL